MPHHSSQRSSQRSLLSLLKASLILVVLISALPTSLVSEANARRPKRVPSHINTTPRAEAESGSSSLGSTSVSSPLTQVTSPSVGTLPSVGILCDTLREHLKQPQFDRRALSKLLAPPSAPSWRYRGARKRLFRDVAPQLAEGSIEALYTGRRARTRGRKSPRGFNCEHLWPRAWMSGKRSARRRMQEADLHNLYPSEMKVNSRRGHLPFGEVIQNRYEKAAPSAIGLDARGIEVVEVRDEYKGDVARTIMYMAARWNLPLYRKQEIKVLLEWSRHDAPSAVERRRDTIIAEAQGNANPLVSCPELIEPLSRVLTRR